MEFVLGVSQFLWFQKGTEDLSTGGPRCPSDAPSVLRSFSAMFDEVCEEEAGRRAAASSAGAAFLGRTWWLPAIRSLSSLKAFWLV